MATTKDNKMDRKRTRDNEDDFFLIRAKGQYLRVPKDQEHDGVPISSGTDKLNLVKPKKRKKVISRKEQRKMHREEKKTKKKNFFLKNVKSETTKQKPQGHKPSTSKDTPELMDVQTLTKKKKRKRKRKNSTPTERDLEVQRLKEENEKEDKQINRLEKLLNMKNKKNLPTQFKADGLDFHFKKIHVLQSSLQNFYIDYLSNEKTSKKNLLEVCDHQRYKLDDASDSENDAGLEKYLKAFSRNKKDKSKGFNTKKDNIKRKGINAIDNESDLDWTNEDDEDDSDDDVEDDDDDDESITEESFVDKNDSITAENDGENISDTSEDDDDDDDDQSINSNTSNVIENDEHSLNADESDNINDDDDDINNGQGESSDDYDEDDIDDNNNNTDDEDDDNETDKDISKKDIPSKNNTNLRSNTEVKYDPRIPSGGKGVQENSTKYIPPHLRGTDSCKSSKEQLNKVRRQLKGLLNRLSEGNLQVVCSEIEELFNHNSRNDMNELLTSLILDSCVSSTLMSPKLLMEHCLLLAVLNSNIGMEIGAHFLQTLAVQFDRLHKAEKSENSGKEIFNVVSLFSHLYNFKVIHCGLIYDIIRLLSDGFQEQDIDLLLLILKSTGAEIRRDDPGSLKDIILQIQAKAASASDLSNDSRVRFMLEIISNLRNNNLRKIPGYDPSQVEHLRKLLRSVIRDYNRSSSSQLQISLQDLLEADTKGRWWIIGSAWSGRQESRDTTVKSSAYKWNSQLLELARKQRMNTDVKKNIFCVMMTSEDYVDAFERLLRLNLKDVQAREIVHVLVDCCLKEKSYNPFYAYLGQKFCEYNRSYQVTFQYTLWDKFKVIDSLSESSVHNMSFLLSHLVASKALYLSILKAVNFMELEKPSVRFFKHFFSYLLTQYPSDTIRKSFERIATLKDLAHLRQGMAIFIRHFIAKKKKHDGESSITAERIQSVMDVLQSSSGSVL